MNLNLPFFQQSLPLFTQSDAEMIDVLRHISREHDVIRDLIVALGELALSAKQGDLPQLLKTALSPKRNFRKFSRLPCRLRLSLRAIWKISLGGRRHKRGLLPPHDPTHKLIALSPVLIFGAFFWLTKALY